MIANFVDNTQKTGAANRTAVFYNARRELLHSYWAKFMNNHDQLVSVATNEIFEAEYFKRDVYQRIEMDYISALTYITTEFEQLTTANTSNSRGAVNSGIKSTAGSSTTTFPAIKILQSSSLNFCDDHQTKTLGVF